MRGRIQQVCTAEEDGMCRSDSTDASGNELVLLSAVAHYGGSALEKVVFEKMATAKWSSMLVREAWKREVVLKLSNY